MEKSIGNWYIAKFGAATFPCYKVLILLTQHFHVSMATKGHRNMNLAIGSRETLKGFLHAKAIKKVQYFPPNVVQIILPSVFYSDLHLAF